MNSRKTIAASLALATALTSPISAIADTTVPQYGREAVHVASGSSAVSGAVAVSDDARLVKSGNGAATLDKESIVTPNAPDIDVLDGSLTIGSNGGTPVVPAEPTALLETAALWLAADADKANFTTRTSGNNTLVDVWRDVRDTDASTTNYPYAATPSITGFTAPILSTDDAGNRCLYFRGYKQNCTMHLHKTDGISYSNANERLTSTTVFAVTRIANTWGNLLGNCRMDTSYQTGSTKLPAAYYGAHRNPSMRSMRFFDNGESRDVLHDKIDRGLHLLEWCHSSKASGSFDALFEYAVHLRYNLEGGDYLMELIVFSTELPEADRLAIEAYLAAKYGISSPGANLRVAAGATATLSTGGLAVGLSGEGAVEATASGNTFAASGDSPFGGSLKLADGVSATITGSGVPLSLEAGDSLDVSGETAALAKTAAADAVEKTGTGMARVTALPAGVSKLAVKGGCLVLAAPVADAMPVADGSVTEATIPIYGFENNEPRPAWSWKIADWGVSTWPIAGGKRLFSGVYLPTSFDAPEGTRVFVLKRATDSLAGIPWAEVNSVTVPVTGRYELTFFGGGRYSDVALGLFRVLFISGATTNECDETDCFHVSTGFVLHRVLTPVLEAGNWTMRIHPNTIYGDSTSAVDDFHMRLVTENVAGDGAWRLPNGGFENLELHTSANPSYWTKSGERSKTSLNQPSNTTSNKVESWTFTQGGLGVSGIPSVGLVDDAMITMNNKFGNPYLNRYGKRFLGFWSNDGTATSAAFSPPAGVWQVRFKSAFAGCHNYAGNSIWHGRILLNLPKWRVTVSVNGEEAMTATSSACGFNKWAATVPDGSFTVADGDTVTVAIAQTDADAAGCIDDVELVPADGATALAAPTPDLPADLSVEVASGATLDLDFPGTVKIRSLRLGNRHPGGIVSAETHPDYISGTGSLEVPPPATVMIMR